jgi:hypothetical protein
MLHGTRGKPRDQRIKVGRSRIAKADVRLDLAQVTVRVWMRSPYWASADVGTPSCSAT